MATGGVSIDGLTQLVSSLDRASEELVDFTEPHRDAMRVLVSAAVPNTPRRSGALAAGHRIDATPTTGAVVNDRVYAGPIHWGWPARGIRAQSWLTDTATRLESKLIKPYEDHVDSVVGRI